LIRGMTETATPAAAIDYRETRDLALDDVLALYRANGWSSAEKPDRLLKALLGSHALVTAWDGKRLVALGNAISDGHLVVYYPHLLVMPEYQRAGVGAEVLRRLKSRYEGFHQQVIMAVHETSAFYERGGFRRADGMEPMWIYSGADR
jgi:GNAT superfamily N-acetyltransferase